MYSSSSLGNSIRLLLRRKTKSPEILRDRVILCSLVAVEKILHSDKYKAKEVDRAYCQMRANWPNPVDPTKKLT